MHLHQELQELLSHEDQESLFLSVYLDTSVNPQGRRTFQLYLKRKSSLLAKLQEHRSEEFLLEFQTNLRQIQSYLDEHLEPETQGVALFSCLGQSYFKALQLPVAVRNKFALSRSPNLDILIELVERSHHYYVVTVEQNSGTLHSVYLYHLMDSKALHDENIPGRTKVGGWSQMRYQRHRQDHIMHFMKDFADHLDTQLRKDKPHSIVLLGTAANLAEFRKHLSTEAERLVTLSHNIPPHKDEKELIAKVRSLLERFEEQEHQEAVKSLYDRLCEDYLAVAGLDDTLFSLQTGRLERLFVSRKLDSRGYRCTYCGFIFSESSEKCSYCQNPMEEVEIRNRIEKIAEHHDVTISLVNEGSFLDALGGVGGFLRF